MPTSRPTHHQIAPTGLAALLFLSVAGCSSCAGVTSTSPNASASATANVVEDRAPLGPAPEFEKSAWKDVARGVAWDANWGDRANGWYGGEKAKSGLEHLKTINVDWIAVTPFSHQSDINEPRIEFRENWGGLDADVVNAHERGIKVMVKPHIWSNQFWDGSGAWRGHIRMRSEADWVTWFADYEKWIVHSAQMAQKLEADAFCIGLEYLESSRAHADKWRGIIKAVRAVYKGPLTYGAHESEMDLPFWDELDAIGVNAYFKVADTNNPTREEIRAAWEKHVPALEALSVRYARPIVFTEVGYASIDGAARAPFRWPGDKDTEDQDEQAASYAALFDLAPRWPWFAGMFIWKYKITVKNTNTAERHYVFQGKKAEKVVKEGFGKRFARQPQ